jgi:N-acyl-D-amino-acid deacylase
MFDLVLIGGRVVDGTGAPWYYGDVAVSGERIAAVGNLAHAEARETLSVTNKVVCPGFVDAHVHGDLALLADPTHEPAIRQGVTTYIIGQDGCGFAPASEPTIAYMRQYTAGFTGVFPNLDCDWSDVDQYLARFHRQVSLNVAYLVPNGSVRMEVLGLERRSARADELQAMRRLVRNAMDQGAIGLSSGLDYIPSLYADARELSELCKQIVPYGGVYVSHMRTGRGTRIHEGIDEVYAIGRTSGCRLHISHFNFTKEYLARIDMGRANGFDITFDSYPYRAGMSLLAMLVLPESMQVGGIEATLERLADKRTRRELSEAIERLPTRPESIQLAAVDAPEYRALEGQMLVDAARLTRLTVPELVCELLVASRLAVGAVVFDTIRRDDDLVACMTHPCQMACSDGIFFGGSPHPRGYGAFAKFLGEYAREKGAWSLEEAVRHLSYHAAARFRLPERGLVRPGMVADLVVFDPERIGARATYRSPKELAVGVEHVLVGGVVTLRDGVHTGATNGQALRRTH